MKWMYERMISRMKEGTLNGCVNKSMHGWKNEQTNERIIVLMNESKHDEPTVMLMFAMQKDACDQARKVIIIDVTHPIPAEVGRLCLDSKLNTGGIIFKKFNENISKGEN